MSQMPYRPRDAARPQGKQIGSYLEEEDLGVHKIVREDAHTPKSH